MTVHSSNPWIFRQIDSFNSKYQIISTIVSTVELIDVPHLNQQTLPTSLEAHFEKNMLYIYTIPYSLRRAVYFLMFMFDIDWSFWTIYASLS